MKKYETRSAKYQHLFLESIVPNEMMEAFGNEDSIYGRLNPYQYDERLLDLEEELKKEFWRIVETELTPRQREIIELYAQGLTQQEIAKKLNLNQSTCQKSIFGAAFRKTSKNTAKIDKKSDAKSGASDEDTQIVMYGGSKKKIQSVIEQDEKIKDILSRMRAIREEKW